MNFPVKLINNIFSNWTGFTVNILIAFFLSPLIVNKLGNTYYGLWVIVLQLTGYLGILELGVRSSVVKYISQHHANNDKDGINHIVGAAISLYSISAVLCLLFAGIFAAILPGIFNIQEVDVLTARWLVVITGVTVAQGFIFNVFYGVLMGIQRYDVYNKVFIGTAFLRAILIVIVLRQGFGIIALALIQFLANMFTNMIIYVYCRKYMPFLKVRMFNQHKAIYKSMLSYSIVSFIVTISQKVIYQTDAFIIGFFMSVSFVTFYSIPFTLVEYMRRFVIAMTEIFVPASSEMSAKGEMKQLQQLLVQGTRMSILVGGPFCIVFIIMGHTFIKLWMGLEYADKGQAVLVILAVTNLISLIHLTTREILFGMAKHKLNALCYSGEALFNICISIILVMRWGIEGVAIGTAIPHVVLALLVFPRLASKNLQLPIKRFLRCAVLPAIVPLIPFSLGCIFINKYFNAQSLAVLFGQVMLLLPVFLVTSWFVSFDKNERIYFKMLSAKKVFGQKEIKNEG